MDHAPESERLQAWLDGELAAAEAAEVAAHVAGCEACGTEVHALRRTMAALSALRSPEAGGPDLLSGVVDRVRRRSRGRFFGPDGRRIARLEWVSAAMLAVVVVLYVVLRYARPALLDLR